MPIPVQPVEGDDAEELAQAIVKLPAKLKEVILLYYYQDMNMAEIAKTLNTSVSTVSRRLDAARKTLLRQLEGE